MNTFRALQWRPDALLSPAKKTMKGIPDAVRSIRYPFRLLRYWFVHELVLDEMKRRGAEPIAVAEIGIDDGQMLAFSQHALAQQRQSRPWSRWNGFDCSPPTSRLKSVGYDELVQVNIEDRDGMAVHPKEKYDVIILLHVIEHLFEPKRALQDIATWLKPGGIIIGGSPGTPEFARAYWERGLRRKAGPGGHVSVISSKLLRRWADELDLQTELLSGAFFMRKKGFALENHHWWLRANLAFGAAFPAWPGELYWAWRKPQPTALQRADSVASAMEG